MNWLARWLARLVAPQVERHFEARLEECHAGWLRRFEEQQEIDMAGMDDLMTSLAAVHDSVNRVDGEVTKLRTELAAAGVEDPRVAQAHDALKAMKATLDTIVPPPPPPEVQPPS